MAFGSSVLTHKKEQQIKIAGEFKPTVDCLCAIRRGFVAVYIDLYFISSSAIIVEQRMKFTSLINSLFISYIGFAGQSFSYSGVSGK